VVHSISLSSTDCAERKLIDGFFLRMTAVGIRSSFGSRGAFAFRALMMFLNNGVFFVMWLILFSQVPSFNGWTLDDMLLLFGYGAVAFGITVVVAGGFSRIPEMIQTGEMASTLLRPRSSLGLVLASRSDPFGWGDITSGLIMIALSGRLTFTGWLLIIPVTMLTTLTVASAGVVFFSFAFWLKRGEEVAFRLFDLVISFSMYPESIFPFGVRLLLYSALPAGFITFLPVQVLGDHQIYAVLLMCLGAMTWAIMARTVFYCGLRRLAR
jgi:ABC-2 type transport system permease protein